MSEIGRNAPCPCGSGKKYKKCCLPKESPQANQPTHHDRRLELADSLRARILKFIKKGRYDRYHDEAFDLYWQTLEPDLAPPEMDRTGYLGFLEWFIHDFPIPLQDRPVIQLFLESNPILPAEEMQVLQDWQDAHISVYQIKEVKSEQGVLAEDIFTGEECFVSDVSLSRQARKWQMVTFRRIKVLDEWHGSSVVKLESPDTKEEIHSLMMEFFHQHQIFFQEMPIKDFLRQEGYLLHQRFLTLQADPGPYPEMLASDDEDLTFWEAWYDLDDLPEAVSRLASQEDFQESDREEDGQGQIFEVFFNWLKKKKPGQKVSGILGNITLTPDQLILETADEKRLARGKKRLERVLAGLLRHQEDTVSTLDDIGEDDLDEFPEDEDLEAEIPLEIQPAALQEYLDQHYQEWLDTPLPALQNKTPRTAITTEEGRRLVEDLLRTIEYHHSEEELPYDTSWIRKELGL